jgi:AcrR family transcriptional regulator
MEPAVEPRSAASKPAGPASGVSRGSRTVQALLDVGERLFAERGVDRVSVREIVRQSGQLNASAAQYHFGSREALIVAVVERRMAVVNATRNRWLDAMEATGQGVELRALITAGVEPLAEYVRTTDWGARYVQIVAELAQHPASNPETQWDRTLLGAMDRIDTMIHRCVPEVPAATMRRRLRMIRGYVPYSLAGWIRVNGPVATGNVRAFRRDVLALIDFMTAGVGAPV